jgi:lactaldehyde dehydrogenase/glycolaldehyde dehydrogenase
MARKVAPALITGNTIVIKPSSIAPNTIMLFTTLLKKVDLPKGVLNVVCGSGGLIGDALVRNPITGIVSLTGSLDAGQQIISAGAQNITKVSLELGGKAPAIVADDADLDITIEAVTASRIIFSGQVCNCAERVYVDKKIYEPFVEKLKARFKKVKTADAFDAKNPEMSSQVSKEQLEKVDAMVQRAKKEGAEVVIGGKPNTAFKKGFYYQPTILTNVKQKSEIVQDEIFGPVLPVMPYTSFDEAIALANDCQYGLTSSIFSNNINKVQHAIEKLKFGEVYVNREHFEGMQGFHAGWRKSGIGGADGKHGMEEYLQTKVVYLQKH